MIDPGDDIREQFTTTPWDHRGIATLEATGADARSAVEFGLRAVLTLAIQPALTTTTSGRSAPIRGEGDDLANLFAEMVEDLLAQIEFFGGGLHDVAVDGVLRRDGGAYTGWGYATGTLEPAPPPKVPRLAETPTVVEEGECVVIRAQLHRT